jgi:hypothetical protein
VRVASEKTFQPQHIRVVGAADDDRAAGPAPQQKHAAQDQGAHDPLTKLGLFHQEIAQPRRRNDQGFDRLCRHAVDKGRPARQLGQLSHKGARPVGHDQLALTMTAMLRNIDMAGKKEKSARRNFAGGEDVSARRVGSAFSKSGNPGNTGNIWSCRASVGECGDGGMALMCVRRRANYLVIRHSRSIAATWSRLRMREYIFIALSRL